VSKSIQIRENEIKEKIKKNDDNDNANVRIDGRKKSMREREKKPPINPYIY
jgi:hypothetical protein